MVTNLIVQIAIEAFDDFKPKTRYAPGEDARQLIKLAKRTTHEYMDKFLRLIYKQQGTVTDMGSRAGNK